MEVYNVSQSGTSGQQRSMLQYIAVAGVTQVFSTPSQEVLHYIDEHLKVVCHTGGPYCGGPPDSSLTPLAAVHVRRGDSCDRERNEVSVGLVTWGYMGLEEGVTGVCR